jgi:hypothetical protein
MNVMMIIIIYDSRTAPPIRFGEDVPCSARNCSSACAHNTQVGYKHLDTQTSVLRQLHYVQ